MIFESLEINSEFAQDVQKVILTHKEDVIIIKRDGKIGVFEKTQENQLKSKMVWDLDC